LKAVICLLRSASRASTSGSLLSAARWNRLASASCSFASESKSFLRASCTISRASANCESAATLVSADYVRISCKAFSIYKNPSENHKDCKTMICTNWKIMKQGSPRTKILHLIYTLSQLLKSSSNFLLVFSPQLGQISVQLDHACALNQLFQQMLSFAHSLKSTPFFSSMRSPTRYWRSNIYMNYTGQKIPPIHAIKWAKVATFNPPLKNIIITSVLKQNKINSFPKKWQTFYLHDPWNSE